MIINYYYLLEEVRDRTVLAIFIDMTSLCDATRLRGEDASKSGEQGATALSLSGPSGCGLWKSASANFSQFCVGLQVQGCPSVHPHESLLLL